MTRALHSRLNQLGPRPSFLLCFLCGALMALCFAPFHYWPLALVSIPVFYLMLESSASRAAAMRHGFAFGYGYFMAGTWWIANAMLVDVAAFGWMIPLSILGLSAVFAFWFVLFALAFWWRRSGKPSTDLLYFAVLWVVFEYWRSFGIFGFPWNLAGYIALVSLPVAQLASVFGTFGLSFFVILLALVPVLWLKPNIPTSACQRVTALALLLLALAYSFGTERLPQGIASTSTRMRLVQPAIPQAVKWTKEGIVKSFEAHAFLSQQKGDGPIPPIILWSESSMPFTLYSNSVWPQQLQRLVPPGGMLMGGAVRADDSGHDLHIWNSLIAIDAHGAVRGSYDKHQLVPFGEFVPLRSVLPLNKITPGDTDFSRGQRPRTLTLPGVPPFSPLICYEAIFPWAAVDRGQRPEWLLNVTNDGWYGDSPGPYQHFSMARMRSIEQGLPLVRVANNGISAVVDPYGRIVKSLPLDARGVIDATLPQPLSPTLYARYGEMIPLIVLVLAWGGEWLILMVKKN